MKASVINPDPVLDTKQASEYTGQPAGTLANLRYQRKGPRFLKIGEKVGYRQSALDEWLASSEVNTGPEAA